MRLLRTHSIDTRILLSAPFLLSLVILAVNDHLAKQMFASMLTGKLSDFAGLFAFVLFLRVLMPERRRAIAIATVLGFCYWKSPLSGGLIEIWNDLPFGTIGRVVDYTDLVALVVVPFAYLYQPRSGSIHIPQPMLWLLVLLSMLPLVATTCNRPGVQPRQVYHGFDVAKGAGEWCMHEMNLCRKPVVVAGRAMFELTDTLGRRINDSLFDCIRLYDRNGSSWQSVMYGTKRGEYRDPYRQSPYYEPVRAYLEVNVGGTCVGDECTGGRWGILDTTGRVIVPPRLVAIDYLSEWQMFLGAVPATGGGLRFALFDSGGSRILDPHNDSITVLGPGLVRHRRTAEHGGRWGVVDRGGRVVLAPSLDTVTDIIHEGNVRFRQNGLWGFVDTLGQVSVTPRFLDAGDFYEGMARARSSETQQWGLIDRQGRFVVPAVYQTIGNMRQGRAAARRPGEKIGYIDTTGTLVIPPQFETAGDFARGGASVVVDGERRKIDRFGTWYTDGSPGRGLSVVARYEGSTGYSYYGGRYGYMDSSGRVVIEPKFYFAGPFVDGRARVQPTSSYLYGFIDTTGTLVIPALYSSAHDFSEGLAVVQLDNTRDRWRHGYIDRNGTVVIDGAFTYAYSFSNGLAAVGVLNAGKARYGYINRKGEIVIKPQFDWVEAFTPGGTARIAMGGTPGSHGNENPDLRWGVVNAAGRVIVPPRYEKLWFYMTQPMGISIGAVMEDIQYTFDSTGHVVSRHNR